MKRPQWLSKIPYKKIALWSGGLFIALGMTTVVVYGLKPLFKEGFNGAITHAFQSTVQKITEIQKALDENQTLRQENAQLRFEVESRSFQRQIAQAKDNTQTQTKIIIEKTGSPYGSLIESIEYTVPSDTVSANNLQTLAYSYLKGNEFAKSAKIFNYLVYESKVENLKTPTHLLMLGISLYHLNHWTESDRIFGDLIKLEDHDDTLAIQAQARLWKALVSKKMGKDTKTQFWLQDLVDHHPHSNEASWVNRVRKPANAGSEQ